LQVHFLILLTLKAVRYVGDYVEVGKISSELSQLRPNEVKWTLIEAKKRLAGGRLHHGQLAFDSRYAVLGLP
jgi:hypothetical protein